MPLPLPLAGALISAGGQVAGGAINAFATGQQNRKSRQWAEHMYDRQYNDNIAFWQMQNAYNDPAQQMQRLKAAGLNPNLVYGSGVAAASGNAGNISTPDVQKPEFRVPEFGNAIAGAGGILGNYLDYEIKLAQADNLRTQNTVLLEEAALKAAQRDQTLTQTERSRFDLGFETELRDVSADARREQLRALKTGIDVSLSRNEREAAMNASNLREAAERILSMRAQRANTQADLSRIRATAENVRKDNVLKQLDIELRRNGIQPNDPIWTRILTRYLNDKGLPSPGESVRQAWDRFRYRGGSGSW